MLMRQRLAVPMLAVAVGLMAAPAAQAKTVTVTKARSGGTVTLKAGDKLVVRLAENPSTGYTWGTVTKPTALKQLSSRYVAPAHDPSGPPIVGAPGTRVFTYLVRHQKAGTLVLSETGPSGAAGGRFTLKVRLG
jgi:predicted secreted protein